MESLGDTVWPRLQYLSITSANAPVPEAGIRNVDFFHSWQMPALKGFFGSSVTVVPKFASCPNLVSCELVFSSRQPFRWDFSDTISSLDGTNMPSLACLTLVFDHVAGNGVGEMEVGENPTAVLPNLTVLDLKLSDSDGVTIYRLLEHFTFPKLEMLVSEDQDYTIDDWEDADWLSAALIPSPKKCPALRDVTLTINGRIGKYGNIL